MLRQAAKSSVKQPNIEYQKGVSVETGLFDECTDIVTIAVALHWMDPLNTFTEVLRILRPGGVFASIDNDWPPTFNLEALDKKLEKKKSELMDAQGFTKKQKTTSHKEQFANMQKKGLFRYTKEIAVYGVEQVNAERMNKMLYAHSDIQMLLKSGITEDDLGLPNYKKEMKRILGDELKPLYFTYRLLIGMK